MTQRMPHPLTKLTRRMLPFADAASRDLPIGQLLRLSLFQVSVGLASVMLLGTLNRVMIVELSVPAMIVAIMIALPVLIAPFGLVRFGRWVGLPSCHLPCSFYRVIKRLGPRGLVKCWRPWRF